MAVDVNTINRLLSTLNQSKIQSTNPALYQCIQALINATQQQVSALNDDTNTLVNNITNNTIGGISELTGDVTAGPGSGSQVATIGTVTSWTPVLKFGGGTTGITYATQTGHYYKIGKVVVVFGHIVLTSQGSSTGNATIEGLPVAVASEIGGFSFPFVINITPFDPPFGTAAVGTTVIDLNICPLISNMDDTMFSNTTELVFYGAYLTS